MTCHSEIIPALSTFCLLLLRLQAHCLPPLDVLDYLDLLHQHNLSWAARRTCVCGWSQGAPQPSLGGVHPHLQSLYLQLALSDIMSLLLNNSFWAKTVTYSMDLLHGRPWASTARQPPPAPSVWPHPLSQSSWGQCTFTILNNSCWQ